MGKRAGAGRAKVNVTSEAMVAKVYPLLEETIEGGIKWGINRLFKYRVGESITHEQLLEDANIEMILHHVMLEICERFDFPEPGEE